MNCSKIQKALNNREDLTGAMLEHVGNCPRCVRAVEAANLINDGLTGERESTEIKATPLNFIRSKLETKESLKSEENFMSQLSDNLKRRPGLYGGLGIALIAFLFVTLVPFSYTVTNGYSVTFKDAPRMSAAVSDNLFQAVNSLGFDDIKLQVMNDEMLFSGLPDKASARELAAMFQAVTGFAGPANIEPILEKVSGSLYAQVMNQLTIEVETDGKTDDEIAQEIQQKLSEQGIANSSVQVTSDGDEKNIQVNFSSEDDGRVEKAEMIMNIGEGEDVKIEHSGGPGRIEVDSEGKTTAEIKAEVEQKLAAQGFPDANVEVIERPDGQKEIKVTMEQEINK